MSAVSLLIVCSAGVVALAGAWIAGRGWEPCGERGGAVLLVTSVALAVATGASLYRHGERAGQDRVTDEVCDMLAEVAERVDEVELPAVCR